MVLDRVVGPRQPVVDARAFAAVQYQTGVLEVSEVARNIGLRAGQHILNVANAKFTVQQQMEDPQPILVGQSLKKLFQVFHTFQDHIYIRIHA